MLRRYCQRGPSAILFTGGLDSTLLAMLAREHKPLLVFAAVTAGECARYNTSSITISRKIAALLGLRLLVVKISKNDYLRAFPRVVRLMPQPLIDTDLAAVDHLFKQLKTIGIKTLVSGMGSDEIFRLPKPQLQLFLKNKARSHVRMHQRIAARYTMTFHCPYLSPALIRYATTTPLSKRKNKQPLMHILNEEPRLYALIKDRPAAHSEIPGHFWEPFSHHLSIKDENRGVMARFEKTILALWDKIHSASESLTLHQMGPGQKTHK